MATYVNDLANGNVKTFEIIDREQVIKRCLQKCIDRRDTPQFQRDLASKLLNEMNTYHPEGDAESLFRFCRMLSPVRLADLRTDDHLSHHAAEKACYFKIPLVEWNMYMRVILEDADYIVAEDEDDPARWWLERKDTFPILSGIANFLLTLPTVVTSCDSLLSRDDIVFDPRRRRLDPAHAGLALAWGSNSQFYQDCVKAAELGI
mmetsp:Transcript_23726/g.27465  ORF Transcript_23726/g.27465 Transcript_23726/m.27465 type:complete len:205 (-) Transcript_23726:89-703(-)